MKVRPGTLSGVLVIEPEVRRDDRGHFIETFRADRYKDAGIGVAFVQDNHSRSVKGTVRGLHFQAAPGQPKLVRVARGAAYDVVVDIRRSSQTFGHWEAFELDDVGNVQVFVPPGFAHGFCALTDVVDFVYKVGSYYSPATEAGIAWDDPDLAIPWPVTRALVSGRDSANPHLRDALHMLPE